MSERDDVKAFLASSGKSALEYARNTFGARGMRQEKGNVFVRSMQETTCRQPMHNEKLPRAHVPIARHVPARGVCSKRMLHRKPLVTRTDIFQLNHAERARKGMRARNREVYSERKSMFTPAIVTKPHKLEVVNMAEERHSASLRNGTVYQRKHVGDVAAASPLEAPFFLRNTVRAREGKHSLTKYGITL